MSWTIVVDPETLAFQGQYLTNDPPLMNWPGVQCTCEDPTVVMAVRADDGTVTLIEDPTKVQARTDTQWASVRSQQRQKLYESDWTCSVTDYEVPNKSEWVQYRAALRNVTTQSDPFAIVWPEKPQ